MSVNACASCGQTSLVRMNGEYCFEPPDSIPAGPIIVANAVWQHCGSCGEDILSSELEGAIEDARHQRLGLLAPAEIRNAREKLGLSMQEMSHFLGVEESAYARWENGRSLPTKPGNALIRQMLESPETFMARAVVRESRPTQSE